MKKDLRVRDAIKLGINPTSICDITLLHAENVEASTWSIDEAGNMIADYRHMNVLFLVDNSVATATIEKVELQEPTRLTVEQFDRGDNGDDSRAIQRFNRFAASEDVGAKLAALYERDCEKYEFKTVPTAQSGLMRKAKDLGYKAARVFEVDSVDEYELFDLRQMFNKGASPDDRSAIGSRRARLCGRS